MVIDEAVAQYGTPKQIGDAKMLVVQEEEEQDADVTIVTRDFKQTGTISYDGGILRWDELEKNDGSDIGGAIVETNPDFFIYSKADSNGNVSIKGLSTGAGGGEEAYENNNENILNLVIPQKNRAGNTINKIDRNAFNGREKIKRLILGENITGIGDSAFAGCTQLTDITLPITIKASGDNGKAFEGCKAVSKVKLTKGKNGIGCGYGAIAQNNDYYKKNPWFNAEQEVKVEIAEGVEKIGNNTFRGCSKIQKVKFPKSLRIIDNYAFNGCTGINGELNTIGNLTGIGTNAFDGCTGITGTLTIPEGVTTISSCAFQNTSITKLVIHDNVTEIGGSAFKECTQLTDITLPITLNYAGRANAEPFEGCPAISKIKLTMGKDGIGCGSYQVKAGYDSYYQNTPWHNTEQNVVVEIAEGVKEIGNNTFRECTKIQMIKFPNSLTKIGSCAFNGCTGINGELNAIGNLTGIGANAFDGCTGITGTLTIPEGVTTISSCAFQNTSITKLVIHDNVTEIGGSAFKECTQLTDITLPITLNSAGRANAAPFRGCTAISKIKLTMGKNGIGCSSYQVKAGFDSYYENTPWYISDSSTKNIIIEKGITKIGSNTFNGVPNATYYYTGTEEEWASVQGTSGITISTYNYSE